MNTSKCSVERGSGNVFADLDLPDADTHLLRAGLVSCIETSSGSAAPPTQMPPARSIYHKPSCPICFGVTFASIRWSAFYAS